MTGLSFNFGAADVSLAAGPVTIGSRAPNWPRVRAGLCRSGGCRP
jgi:hypothetical protein